MSTEFDQVERMLEVQRRQAVALEAIAGVLLMQYSLRDDTGCWEIDELHREALYHGTGGEEW